GLFLQRRSLPPGWVEYHDRVRKWGRVGRATKRKPALHVPYFPVDRVGMPPACIGAGRDETDDCRPLQGTLIGFAYPVPNGGTIGRIHPAHPRPGLFQSIRLRCKVARTLGVTRLRRDIEREAKLGVQLLEEPLRRFPFDREGAMVDL